jgi:hypothetical protein
MLTYEKQIQEELAAWQHRMLRKPSLLNKATRRVQTKINNLIPPKVQQAITATIKQMVRGVLFGAERITAAPLQDATLPVRETLVKGKIEFYRKTAAIEGGVTGAGGLLLGLADFPLLLSLKLKLLFDIAGLYGYPVQDYKERIYLLYIFQLAFSGHEQRRNVYLKMTNWQQQSLQLPADIHEFDWQTFQIEYRDYIDLAKLAQLVPIIGAPVGFVVNNRLIKKLGITAMNAYRMRWFEENPQ